MHKISYMQKHQTTIIDIARELGISKSTVSRALKDHPDIKSETKEKIRILKEKFTKEGKKESLKKLNDVLAKFQLAKLKTIPAVKILNEGKAVLQELSKIK